jgi:streptogramin lyase
VSLTGNVAVANRSGGLTKFYANPDDCSGPNTSTGPADIVQWGDEDCMAWHTPMAYISQRPVAWTQGVFNKAACAIEDEKVWTSGSTNGSDVQVVLVDGDTGVIEETIPIPGVNAGYYGIYGAAVDSEGNFWGSQLGGGTLVNVNLQTLDIQTWPTVAGGYGMTVDQEGYVWTCSYQAGRFDPVTETWQQANVGGSGGCMSDGGDILWMASSPMVGINRQTLAVEYSIPIPEYVHGVSIDYQGYVWGVSMSNSAYRVDPATGTWDVVGGLVNPYTYSDMTGFALNNVGGGGAPSG